MKKSLPPRRGISRPLLLTLIVGAAGIAAFLVVMYNSGDAFDRCVKDETNAAQCLTRLGGLYNWNPTEAACRFVSYKTDAIIDAGGDAKWRDLFYNERCARLGLPHSLTAAEPGAQLIYNAPYWRCMNDIGNAGNCWDILGRHYDYPSLRTSPCDHEILTLRRGFDVRPLQPTSTPAVFPTSRLWFYAFGNERCWRLGLPHYEAD